jgi:hypothetical protein
VYDAHVRALLQLFTVAQLPPDLFFAAIRRVPFDAGDLRLTNRGANCLELVRPLLEKVDEVPDAAVEALLQSFILVKYPLPSEISKAAVQVVKILTDKNRSAVIRLLDTDLLEFGQNAYAWVALICAHAKKQRPILKYWTPKSQLANQLTKTDLIKLSLEVNGPIIQDPAILIAIGDSEAASPESRRRSWQLLLESGFSPDEVLQRTIVNLRRLRDKAELWLKLQPPDRDLFLLIASLNSWNALDVAFDTIRVTLLSEKIVPLVLRGPAGANKAGATRITAEQARKLQNFDSILFRRKLVSKSLVRYGRAVIEIYGKEKLVRWLGSFVTDINRELLFANDILMSPKQKALTSNELSVLVESVSVVCHLELEIDKEEVAKLKEALE